MHALVLSALLIAWQGGGSMTPTGKGVYPLEVNHDIPFAERLKATGANFPDPGITAEHFGTAKASGKETMNVVMVPIDSTMSSTKAVRTYMWKHKLRAATAEELLAFTMRYGDFAKEFPLVALGSVWTPVDDGISRVLIAEPHLGGLKVDIEYLESDDWTLNCRFLAVPLKK